MGSASHAPAVLSLPCPLALLRLPRRPCAAPPRSAVPCGRIPAPSARSAGRVRRVSCLARPARRFGTGRDPRASPRPGPPGPGPPRAAPATSARFARSGAGPSRVRLSRSSLCRVSSCRACSSAHSFRARVSRRQNPSQRWSSTLRQACASARRQVDMSTRSSSPGSLARRARPDTMPSRRKRAQWSGRSHMGRSTSSPVRRRSLFLTRLSTRIRPCSRS